MDLKLVKNKEGRVDCLLHSLSTVLTQKLESHLNLPGLSDGVMPIIEDEIKKNVPARTVIPSKYKNLARLVGEQINKIPPTSPPNSNSSNGIKYCHCTGILCGGIGSTCSQCGGMIL